MVVVVEVVVTICGTIFAVTCANKIERIRLRRARQGKAGKIRNKIRTTFKKEPYDYTLSKPANKETITLTSAAHVEEWLYGHCPHGAGAAGAEVKAEKQPQRERSESPLPRHDVVVYGGDEEPREGRQGS